MVIKHRHPLKIIEAETSSIQVKCSVCLGSCSGPTYTCSECGCFLHKSCRELPENFQNLYHPHPLTLIQYSRLQAINCAACLLTRHVRYSYLCSHCKAEFDVGCTFYTPTAKQGYNDSLIHLSHHFHPLFLRKISSPDKSAICVACGTPCFSSPTYYCNHCVFFLHKACSEVPMHIYPPNHKCLLKRFYNDEHIYTKIYNYFRDCDDNHHHDYVHVTGIDFSLVLSLTKQGRDETRYRHFSHWHTLKLVQESNVVNDCGFVSCFACGKPCSGPFYGCIECKFFLHKSCTEELPIEIHHFFHPCPLTLCIKPNSLKCGACGKTIRGFYFYCKLCKFSMDVECALLPTIKPESQEQFYHFSHGHPLTPTDVKEGDRVQCSACSQFFSGPALVCQKCNFVLQQSCFELPQKIQHRFHKCHSTHLTLLSRQANFASKCNICCKYCRGRTYYCNMCDFYLHQECIKLRPNISYEGHNHLLLFLENINGKVKCNACHTPCDSNIFHCPECSFNLHFKCGPLPYKIKHKRHVDHLILTSSPVDDESDEFYCDSCEEKRDPRLPIYYCKDCYFIAEIKCVMSELILALKGQHGDVELSNPTGWISGKVITKSTEVTVEEQTEQGTISDGVQEGLAMNHAITLDEILATFSEDEKMELNNVLAAAGRVKIKEISSENQKDNNRGISKEVALYSDEAYTKFMERLDSGRMKFSSLKFWENEEVVSVGDTMITRKLVPILQDVWDKYGDISTESTLSPQVKMYFLVMLCGTMHNMHETRVVDISEELLLNWWNYLKILQLAEFKVQFATDHLKKVTHAYYGLRVKEKEENREAILDRGIRDISRQIDQLTKKLETLKEHRESITLAKASKSKFIEDCLREATKLKWWPADTGLL